MCYSQYVANGHFVVSKNSVYETITKFNKGSSTKAVVMRMFVANQLVTVDAEERGSAT